MATTLSMLRNEKDLVSFTAGQIILEEGQVGDTMYVVTEGEVDVFVHNRIVETVGEGGFFGEMALIDDQPRSAKVVAKTDCQLAPVGQKRFTFLVQNTPYFAITVMRVMAERLRHQNVLVE